jgi:hypothetical protein
MALSERTKALFEKNYGVSLDLLAGNVEDKEKILDAKFGERTEVSPVYGIHGRGHVAFGHARSAKEADEDTLRMMETWH